MSKPPKGALFVVLSMDQGKESNTIGVYDDLEAMREGFKRRGVNPFEERVRVEIWLPNGGFQGALPEYQWMPPGARNGFDVTWNPMGMSGEAQQARQQMEQAARKHFWSFGFGDGTRRR